MAHFSFPVINPGKEKRKKERETSQRCSFCMAGLELQLAYPLGNTTLLLIKR